MQARATSPGHPHATTHRPGWGVTRLAGLLLTVLSVGALYFFSTGLDGFGPLVWIAPIPVLILALNLPARPTAVIAFIAYLFGSFNLFSYLVNLAPIGVVIASLVIPALAFTLAVLATRYAVLQSKHWGTLAVFPAVWTSYEYVLSVVSPHGTAGSLAYTQTNFLPLIQVASLTGIWGITFILTLVPAGVAVAWHFRRDKRHAVPALVAPLVVGLLLVGYGWARLAQPIAGQPIRVGLATTDTTIHHFQTEQPDEALPVVQAYARRIGELAAQGAGTVVLPEKFVGVTPGYRGEVLRILGEAAQQHSVTVVAGLNQIGPEENRNIAVVFSPDGQVLAEYDKAYLIPGFESGYQPGTRPVEFSILGTTAGVAICKDMDFPSWTAQYARAGAGILFVPAWDFVRDGRLHARMAVVRGIEGGFAVVRSAQEGRVTVSDSLGRVLAEATSSSAPDVLVVSAVQPGPGHTFYSVRGDWFAWLMLLFLGLMLAGGALRTVKTRTRYRHSCTCMYSDEATIFN